MIRWNEVNHFSLTGDRWPEDPDKYLSPAALGAIDRYRNVLGVSVSPSPVTGALARFNGSETSRHFVGDAEDPIRFSDALDLFVETDIRTAFLTAMTVREFGGIGVYFDTVFRGQSHCLMHLDIRHITDRTDSPTIIWYRENHEYYYPLRNEEASKRFLELLASKGL